MNPGTMSGVFLVVVLLIGGCPKRDEVPETAYDPELIAAARAAREEQEQARLEAEEEARRAREEAAEEKGECDRTRGGCRAGYICWDSYFCKQDDPDQCSRAGDKKCHKKCEYDSDCPSDMPYCREIPIHHGSERGVLEKLCVTRRE